MMKLYRFSVLLLAVSASVISLEAQDRNQCAGTGAMYSFDPVMETPAPKGYKPYYISHYGRHGARWCTSAKPYDDVMEYLQTAHDSSNLTELGEQMYQRYVAVYPILKGTHGDLSPKGEEQHKLLADRMVEAYPQIFKKAPVIDARSSNVPRAIVSMAAFCTELQKEIPDAVISLRSYTTDLYIINAVSESNPYLTKKIYEKLIIDSRNCLKDIALPIHPKEFASRIFENTDRFVSEMDWFNLENAFYDTVVHMPCIESPDNLEDFFTLEELRGWWKLSNYKFYNFSSTEQYKALTYSLVRDFVTMADEDAAAGVDVRLRFGHDMVLFSLLELMDINGWGGKYQGIEDVSNNWHTYDIPMASNLRMVLYKNRKGETIGKFMYNEKEVTLPIESGTAPYYNWEDIKSYMLDKADSAENFLKQIQ